MIEIKDKGLILGHKKFGENGTILNIFSESNGIVKGLKKYSPKKNKGLIFDLVSFSWKSRLEEGLGYLNFEIIKSYYILNESFLLALIKASASELCLKLIPLREANKKIFEDLIQLVKFTSSLESCKNQLLKSYIIWEIKLLENLGYGIDFSKCAISGIKSSLRYISPKTGKVVSENIGKPWEKKLLILPDFLINEKSEINESELIKGLKITSHFLDRVLEKVNSHSKYKLIFRKQLLKCIYKSNYP